ncbi:hypothetical protein FMA36_09750 [Komagataeibacter xylinus]|uniref:Uncharacterized protein n=1 Tax=Komagataeibacter xylinus TaxID=28448 RepID=A0A857FNF4_KOMXY|nr:hypothetical protein FMA36_09750 [Komagataeibacter xylinus]
MVKLFSKSFRERRLFEKRRHPETFILLSRHKKRAVHFCTALFCARLQPTHARARACGRDQLSALRRRIAAPRMSPSEAPLSEEP